MAVATVTTVDENGAAAGGSLFGAVWASQRDTCVLIVNADQDLALPHFW